MEESGDRKGHGLAFVVDGIVMVGLIAWLRD